MTAVLAGLSLLFSFLTVLPIWRTPRGYVRIWDFPKIQILSCQAIVLIALLSFGPFFWPLESWVILVATLGVATMLYLLNAMWPYARWAPKESLLASPEQKANLSLYICNVLQDNRDYATLLRQIEDASPDIIMLLETDPAWQNAMRPLEETYPHRISEPLANYYGLLMFSRLPLADRRLRYLVENDIPSVRTEITLTDGARTMFYGLHPRPPQLLDDTVERNIELWVVAHEAREETLPTIVAGDMNDVGWSRTTARFREIGQLKDPRRGRGLFNSFHALHWYLRWPLDHIFHSQEIRLVEMRRMPAVGSDHFPIFLRFHVPQKVDVPV